MLYYAFAERLSYRLPDRFQIAFGGIPVWVGSGGASLRESGLGI
jgi:hypothetical protein